MIELNNNLHCPSDDELMRHKLEKTKNGRFLEITEHLLICDTCLQTLLDYLPETESEWQEIKRLETEYTENEGDDPIDFEEDFIPANLTEEFDQLRQTAIRVEKKRIDFDEICLKGLQAGQIWRPKADNIILPTVEGREFFSDYQLGFSNYYVVIKDAKPEQVGDYSVIRVIPVDNDLERLNRNEIQTENDVIIPANSNPLERDLLLQVWNEKEMLVENLDGYFGDVSKEWITEKTKEYNIISKFNGYDVGKLFSEFKKNFDNFDYKPKNIIREGFIAEKVYRYRATAVAETNYLSFPVKSLRKAEALKEIPVTVAVNKPSPTFLERFENFLEQIKSTTTMFPSGESVLASGALLSGWEKGKKDYLDGKLKVKRRVSVNKDNLLLLQSDDSEFANRLILLGTDKSDLTLALLADNNLIHQDFVSILNFGKNEIPPLFSNKIFDNKDLIKFDENTVRNSIARVFEKTELLAWKKLADTDGTDKSLSDLIHQLVKEREN